MKISQGKSKTMRMQIFWGVEAVYYGIVQVENFWICHGEQSCHVV